ncbi:hypothetical protein ACQ4M4_04730 [Leptolyngbya sp. AN02str]
MRLCRVRSRPYINLLEAIAIAPVRSVCSGAIASMRLSEYACLNGVAEPL